MLRLVTIATLVCGPAFAEETRTRVGKWSQRVETSPLYDTTDVYLSTSATEMASCRLREFRPSIHIRCKEDTTAIFFATQCFMSSGSHTTAGNVTYRVDDRAAQTVPMVHSNDNNALGLWRGRRSIPFVRQLIGGETLTVRLTPYSDSPMTVTFDLAGLDEAIAPLRQSCGW